MAQSSFSRKTRSDTAVNVFVFTSAGCKKNHKSTWGGVQRNVREMYKLACAPVEDSDQTAHPHSLLIRFFNWHSMSSQASGRQLRLGSDCFWCTDWFESSLYAHAKLYLMLDTNSYASALVKILMFSLTPSLPYIMHAICRGKIRLFWCFYGVTYNFIQNHNHWRDLHQFFSCLFETFGTMFAIIFSSDSMSKKKISTAENTWLSTFVYNIIVLEWLGNNGSKTWEWQEFPPLPLLIPININCHPYTSHFRLPK